MSAKLKNKPRGVNIPRKWKRSSKKKKKNTWGAIAFNEGKGTCQVDIPTLSAKGWNNQIYRGDEFKERG